MHEDGEDAVAELEEERVELAAKLGENIQVVGAKRLQAANGAMFSSYVHPPANKVGALVATQGGDPQTARSSRCTSRSRARRTTARDEVPQELVDAEREILEQVRRGPSEAGGRPREDRRRAC